MYTRPAFRSTIFSGRLRPSGPPSKSPTVHLATNFVSVIYAAIRSDMKADLRLLKTPPPIRTDLPPPNRTNLVTCGSRRSRTGGHPDRTGKVRRLCRFQPQFAVSGKSLFGSPIFRPGEKRRLPTGSGRGRQVKLSPNPN